MRRATVLKIIATIIPILLSVQTAWAQAMPGCHGGSAASDG